MTKQKTINALFIITSALAFIYVLVRGFTVGVTYDEAWTINSFAEKSVVDIITYNPAYANNHLINTLLIKLLFTTGNHSLFLARLPNIIAFIVYLFFCYKISRNILNPVISICCFSLLILNPFLLDFFSLARGYGLSMAFFVVSLYFLVNYIKKASTLNVILALTTATLGVLCNFSLLNFYLVLILIINLISFFYYDRKYLKINLVLSLAFSICLGLIIYLPLKKLKETNGLFYGGDTGFYSDTLMSLTKYSLYKVQNSKTVSTILNSFVILYLVSAIVSFVSNKEILSLKNAFLALLSFCILSLVFQHYLIGTLYLLDRTALFFYPLLVFSFCFCLNEFRQKIYSQIILALVVSIFALNFILNANTYKTATWFFDAHSSSILSYLNAKGKSENKKINIDFTWPFERSFYYYILENKYENIQVLKSNDNNTINEAVEYFVFLNQTLPFTSYNSKNQTILSYKKDVEKQYKAENIIIYKNLRKPDKDDSLIPSINVK